MNVPLLEKVDKLIWSEPCCGVARDRERPVNLSNEGLPGHADGREIEQHIN